MFSDANTKKFTWLTLMYENWNTDYSFFFWVAMFIPNISLAVTSIQKASRGLLTEILKV